MTFEDDSEWLDARIAAIEALIVAHETALTTIVGGAQSYTLDTGQTRQTVTKANLSEIRIALHELESSRSALRLRRYGASFVGRPNR